MLSVVHHPAYRLDLASGRRFPVNKAARLAEVLVEEGLVAEGGFLEPEPADFAQLAAAHDPAYVSQVLDGALPPEAERRIGFAVTPAVGERSRAASGGTLLAGRLALREGAACNTAGGGHHAARDRGTGYCVFNDVAVAATALLAEGAVGRVLVVDLDVHQGDGTARIFEDDARVFTFSMHATRNFPARKARSDLDVELDDGCEDGPYLAALADALPGLIESVRPDLVFYNAGVDPHRDDRLGRLSLTDEGLWARDNYVLDACLSRGAPVACVIGGGYDPDIDRLARRHALLHRAARDARARSD